jgi:hypothetical protein
VNVKSDGTNLASFCKGKGAGRGHQAVGATRMALCNATASSAPALQTGCPDRLTHRCGLHQLDHHARQQEVALRSAQAPGRQDVRTAQ